MHWVYVEGEEKKKTSPDPSPEKGLEQIYAGIGKRWRLMLSLFPHWLLVCWGCTPPMETGWFGLWSEDIRAHVPAAAILSLPVASFVDMQGLSRYGIVYLLEPQRLMIVLMGAWRRWESLSKWNLYRGPRWGLWSHWAMKTYCIMLKLSWYALRWLTKKIEINIFIVTDYLVFRNQMQEANHR